MTAAPEGLFPGPDVDGRPTWYGPARSVPDGWEGRGGDQGTWGPVGTSSGEAIMQARPVALPDPDGFTVSLATPLFDSGRDLIVTTVGEMRDRPDLDQWQYADNDQSAFGWTNWDVLVQAEWDEAPDDLPVVVRRRP